MGGGGGGGGECGAVVDEMMREKSLVEDVTLAWWGPGEGEGCSLHLHLHLQSH